MRRLATVAAALGSLALLPGCPSEQKCTTDWKKSQVQQIAGSWYLFPTLLAPIDPAAYPDAPSYLFALTEPARTQGKDRGWSFITTPQAAQRYYGDGQSIGFGLQVVLRPDAGGIQHLFVAQSIPNSPARLAGLGRGDEILKIGETQATLVPLADILAAHGGTLGDAFGPPSTEGVTRWFEWIPNGATTHVIQSATTSLYDIHPVEHYVIPRSPSPAGVIVLRTFVSTADAGLQSAVAAFATAGVTDVIVDVRYNGGGLVSTARLLANLLAAGRAGSVMYTVQFNDAHQDQNGIQYFSATAGAVAPPRIAFVTTRSSASASELVPNVLEPYLTTNVAIVGKRTYGKPVGQAGFQIPLCDDLLYLVTFRLPNAQGDADYYQGLPDTPPTGPPQFSGPFCDAADDLTHDMGAAAESSTATALYWLANGTCPPAPLATRLPSADSYPLPDRPSIEQFEIPGLF